MSRPARTRLGWALLAVSVALTALGVWLEAASGAAYGVLALVTEITNAVPYAAVGAVIVSRRPHNAIGWILCAVGALWALEQAATGYALYAAGTGADLEGVALISAWLAAWIWEPPFMLLFVFLPLLFPDGRMPSPRWRPVAWVGVAMGVAGVGVSMFWPGPMEVSDVRVAADNPVGLPRLLPILEAADMVVELLFLPMLIAVLIAVAVRYRRGRRDERQQLKWFLAAVALVVVAFFVSALPPSLQAVADLVGLAGTVGIPVAVGIAVLRYRLYDIDRIVSRTVAYALITAVLGGLYALGVLLLGQLLAPLGPDSQLAVAGSTLAVAAAFGPVRRWVQAAVDRRFNRARYDAVLTVEAFRGRLRDEIDLDQLSGELLGVVGSTVEPARVSLWLRIPGAKA